MRTAAFKAGSEMELAGLEPATSWVRYRRNEVASRTLSLPEPRSFLLRHLRFAQFGSTDGRSASEGYALSDRSLHSGSARIVVKPRRLLPPSPPSSMH